MGLRNATRGAECHVLRIQWIRKETKSIVFATARPLPAYTRVRGSFGHDVLREALEYLWEQLCWDLAPGEVGVGSEEGKQTLGRRPLGGVGEMDRGRMEGGHSSPGKRREGG